MKKLIALCFVVLAACSLFSFGVKKKDKAALMGIWMTTKKVGPGVPAGLKIFEENGTYYNVAFENGKTIMTHKGKYKILSDVNYLEKVTDVRFNAAWDLKDKEFVNTYALNSDKTQLILAGTVFSKNKKDSLKWEESYQRVQLP